jgi:uncharacterized protein involved in type VI secretion and phage assembly
VKSDSTKGHNGHNYFIFDDTKGNETIYLVAEKDHVVKVGKDRTTTLEKGDDYLKLEHGHRTVELQSGGQTTTASAEISTKSFDTVTQLVIGASVTSQTLNAMGITMHAPALVQIEAPMVIIKGNLWVQGGIVEGTSPPRPV